MREAGRRGLILRPMVAVLAMLLLVCTTSCADKHPPYSADVTIDQDDAGDTIVLKRGDVLELQLPANGTTGYANVVTLSPDVLELKDTGSVSPYGPGDEIPEGAGYTEICYFDAARSGTGTLRVQSLWAEDLVWNEEEAVYVLGPESGEVDPDYGWSFEIVVE